MCLLLKSSLVVLVFLLLFTASANAASITLENRPSVLQLPDDKYDIYVSLNISAVTGTTYYLRGVFFKPNTTEYCGLTWNGTAWFSGPYSSNDGWKNFLPVTISDNTWKGTIQVKPDTENSGCQSSGAYNFKIERFTTSGSSNFDSQNIQTVTLLVPSPTPSPTDIPTPTKVPTPTKMPTPTKQPTVAVSRKTSPSTPSQTVTNTGTTYFTDDIKVPSVSLSDMPTAILGISTVAASEKPSPTTPQANKKVLVQASNKETIPIFAIAFIIGAICLIACGILVFVYIRSKN